MNYQKIYDDLISRAKQENRKKVKGGTYYENHHIIPKCLGGKDEKQNMVLLTGREHFIAHKLLVELHPNNSKIFYAVWIMTLRSNGREYLIGSREYERLRVAFSDNFSGDNHPLKGKQAWNNGVPMTDEAKIKLSIKFKGKKREKEAVKKQLETNKLKYPNGENYKGNLGKTIDRSVVEKQRKSNTGKKRSKSFCENMSKNRVGSGNPMYNKKPWNKNLALSEAHRGKLKSQWNGREKVICPYCGKIGHTNGMTRYHFENCKLKSITNPNSIQ